MCQATELEHGRQREVRVKAQGWEQAGSGKLRADWLGPGKGSAESNEGLEDEGLRVSGCDRHGLQLRPLGNASLKRQEPRTRMRRITGKGWGGKGLGNK